MITDVLFNKLSKNIPYPDGIVPVPEKRIIGRAFFPGGDGLNNHKNLAQVDMMILGQDFDNEANFEESKAHKSESEKPKGSPTWSNLEKIFEDENKISLKNFFFTNAIMGLRKGKDKNTGESKAFKKGNEVFLKECRAFFKEQVKDIKPRLIIGLGRHIPMFLSGTSDDLNLLSKIKRLKDLGQGIEENIIDISFDTHKTKVIFITHPSMYFRNVINRHEDGKEFEYKLIQTAYNICKK